MLCSLKMHDFVQLSIHECHKCNDNVFTMFTYILHHSIVFQFNAVQNLLCGTAADREIQIKTSRMDERGTAVKCYTFRFKSVVHEMTFWIKISQSQKLEF